MQKRSDMTARELLNDIRTRRQSSIQSTTDSSKATNGSDRIVNNKDGSNDVRSSELAVENRGSGETTTDRGRGENNTVGTIRSGGGEDRGSDYSSNEHNERPATDAGQSAATQQTVGKKSRFAPFQQYRDAIKDSFKKSTTTSKTKAKAKTLTEAEIRYIREKLIEVLLWQSDHMDEFIIATTKGHDRSIIIWGDIDRDDAILIANYLLDRGKEDPRVATAVRQMVQLMDKIKLGLVLAPRAYRTLLVYFEKGFSLR